MCKNDVIEPITTAASNKSEQRKRVNYFVLKALRRNKSEGKGSKMSGSERKKKIALELRE